MAKKIQHRIRRSNNEGSIFQRKSDGKWVGSITVGHDEKGQQKKKTVYGNSQAEVAKKLMDISGRMKSYAYETLEKHTFGELMNEWLMVFKKSAVRAKPFETSRIKEKESNIDQYVRFFFISVLKELSKMCLSNDSNGHFYFKIK